MHWITKQDILENLKTLQLDNEEVLLVYGDLSENAQIVGGIQAVVEAIFDAVGLHTTIMVPAHQLTEVPTFFDPNLPETVYDQVPGFDVNMTPIPSGKLAQAFALHKSSVRSNHPLASFVAIGRKADWLTRNHSQTTMFGYGSPLEKAYGQDAKLLCIGKPANPLTALHLLNYFSGKKEVETYSAAVVQGGARATQTFEDLKLDGGLYGDLLNKYAQKFEIGHVEAGDFQATLFDYRELIDFGASSLSA